MLLAPSACLVWALVAHVGAAHAQESAAENETTPADPAASASSSTDAPAAGAEGAAPEGAENATQSAPAEASVESAAEGASAPEESAEPEEASAAGESQGEDPAAADSSTRTEESAQPEGIPPANESADSGSDASSDFGGAIGADFGDFGGDLGDLGDLGSIEELDLEAMLGTVSAVSRRSESLLKAPATVTTVNGRRIRLSGFQSVPEILRTVPGVQVMRNSAGNYVVSLRGLGGLQGNNIVVVIDGVVVNSRVDGSVDWAALPVHVDDIESIEVVRGAVSSIWGANAYTGVINIVTRRAERHVTRARVSINTGSDLDLKPTASGVGSFGTTMGPLSWDLTLTATHDETMSRTPAYTENNEVTQPGHTIIGALTKANLELFRGATLDFVGGGSVSERSGLGHLSFRGEAEQSTSSFGRLALTFNELGFGFDSISLWTRGKSLLLDVEETGTTRPGFSYKDLMAIDGEAGIDVRLDLPWNIGVSFGAASGLAWVDAPFVHPAENAKLRPSYGAYLNADVDILEMIVLTGAVRTDSSAMVDGLELSYRASALYYNDLFGLRLAAGSAFREPSYVEVGARFIDPATNLIQLEGTPGLRPPRVDSYELSLILVPMSTLRIQPTVYLERVSQLIVEDFAPLARKTFRNTDDIETITGAELETSWQFLDNYHLFGQASVLWWPLLEENRVPTTLAEPELNSMVTAYLGFQGRWFGERLGLGVGAGLHTGRDYNVRAGIPPELIAVQVPHTVYFDAALSGRPLEEYPVWLWAKVLSHYPHGAVESPLPNAAQSGTRYLFGIDYRP